MQTPADKVRMAVEAWRRDEAASRVARWRGDTTARSRCRVASAHRWLVSREARDALSTSHAHALLAPGEHQALLEHIALAVEAASLCALGDTLADDTRSERAVGMDRRVLSAIVPELASSTNVEMRTLLARAAEAYAGERVHMVFDARQRADAAAREVLEGWPTDPSEVSPSDARTRAEALLEETQDLAEEALGWAERTKPTKDAPRRWDDVLSNVRCPSLDGYFPRKTRWRRIAACFEALGFGEDLSRRIHIERDHAGLFPSTRFALIDPPRNVRISEAREELGISSELAAFYGLGRGLGYVLAAPALPAALRWPAFGSTPRALGALFMNLLADRGFVKSCFPVLGREVDAIARAAATALVLEVRLAAACVLFRLRETHTPEARLDLAGELWAKALSSEPAPALAGWFFSSASQPVSEMQTRRAALIVHTAMRDRYDEDWFRNPRTAEAIRAGASRGGGLSAEAWCTELGGDQNAAGKRLTEMFGA